MKQLTVVRKMILGFSGLAILLLLTSLLSFFGLQDIKQSASTVVEEKMPMQKAMTNVRTNVLSLSNLTINAYYEADAVALQRQKDSFEQLVLDLSDGLQLLNNYVAAENKESLNTTVQTTEQYVSFSEKMFSDIAANIEIKKKLAIKSEN